MNRGLDRQQLETYPGTNMIRRLCYGCGNLIENLEDVWIEFDTNCAVCSTCREQARDEYPDERTFLLSIVQATSDDAKMLNELDQG